MSGETDLPRMGIELVQANRYFVVGFVTADRGKGERWRQKPRTNTSVLFQLGRRSSFLSWVGVTRATSVRAPARSGSGPAG